MRLVFYSLYARENEPHAYQLLRSVASLREYNGEIGIYLFLYGDLTSEAERALRLHNVKIHRPGSYLQRLKEASGAAEVLACYPTLHKFLCLGLIPPQATQVLYLDCDTFFFGDVVLLFKIYRTHDVYAREEPYSSQSHLGFRPSIVDEPNLARLSRQLKIGDVVPFNSGVLLMNNGVWRKLHRRRKQLFAYALRLIYGLALNEGGNAELDATRSAVVATLRKRKLQPLQFPGSNTWIVAQVSLWLTAASVPALQIGIFSRDQVIQDGEFLQSDTNHQPVVCHYFTNETVRFFACLEDRREKAAAIKVEPPVRTAETVDQLCTLASQFRCLLEDQPHYLAPPSRATEPAAHKLDMVVNSHCWFSWIGSMPLEIVKALPLLRDLDLRGGAVWVGDLTTGAVLPYWPGVRYRKLLQHVRPGDRFDCSDATPAELDVLLRAGVLVTRPDSKRSYQQAGKVLAAHKEGFQKGYIKLPNLLNPFQIGALRQYVRYLVRCGGLRLGDDQCNRRYVVHNESVARFYHHQLAFFVGIVVGETVKPSYVYTSAYQGGAVLEPHTDRPQCEFSVTLCIDQSSMFGHPLNWPLRLKTSRRLISIQQDIGDAILYRGRELPHSRSRLADNCTATYLLLHYVPADYHGSLS
jgi:hypothetical protein